MVDIINAINSIKYELVQKKPVNNIKSTNMTKKNIHFLFRKRFNRTSGLAFIYSAQVEKITMHSIKSKKKSTHPAKIKLWTDISNDNTRIQRIKVK